MSDHRASFRNTNLPRLLVLGAVLLIVLCLAAYLVWREDARPTAPTLGAFPATTEHAPARTMQLVLQNLDKALDELRLTPQERTEVADLTRPNLDAMWLWWSQHDAEFRQLQSQREEAEAARNLEARAKVMAAHEQLIAQRPSLATLKQDIKARFAQDEQRSAKVATAVSKASHDMMFVAVKYADANLTPTHPSPERFCSLCHIPMKPPWEQTKPEDTAD